MQMAILAMVDAFATKGRALTFFPPPALLMRGVMMILLTAVVGGAVLVGDAHTAAGIGLWSPFIAPFGRALTAWR